MGRLRALLISTYELGRQPFGLASPAAWLRREGLDVRTVDVAKEKLPLDAVRQADLIAVHLPMHTATRLAVPLFGRVRSVNPGARLCAYGLYAPLNEAFLRELGVTDVLGAEFEADLASLARNLKGPAATAGGAQPGPLPRLRFMVPDRSGLPPLSTYATLQHGGETIVAGYTEASRGCRHLCRHCPVVPVYGGQFRIIQPEVVLADVNAQVAAGARHISFGDPDFFNGPTHAMRIVETLHQQQPGVTYDATIKVEHLLKHRGLLPRLRDTGCLFVTTAVESIDDRTLGILDKGHTRADVFRAVGLCRDAGLTLVPTFVPFHPWMTLEGYCELLDVIESLDLIDHVAPIQLTIRLLVPEGSRLLETEELRQMRLSFDPATLAYRWAHSDPRVDALHREVTALVGARQSVDRRQLFDRISDLAHLRAELPRLSADVAQSGPRRSVPYLSEPWYCCAEPNPEQLNLV
jgi:Radical SAM superfamily